MPSVTLSLTVANAADALDFYRDAFGAEELYRMPMPDGSVAHAEFKIGDSILFLSGEYPDWQAKAFPEGATSPMLLGILSEDCDAAFERAVAAGATVVEAPQDRFWGVRNGVVKDPFGYRWSLAKVIEHVTPEEVNKRARELMGGE